MVVAMAIVATIGTPVDTALTTAVIIVATIGIAVVALLEVSDTAVIAAPVNTVGADVRHTIASSLYILKFWQ